MTNTETIKAVCEGLRIRGLVAEADAILAAYLAEVNELAQKLAEARAK